MKDRVAATWISWLALAVSLAGMIFGLAVARCTPFDETSRVCLALARIMR